MYVLISLGYIPRPGIAGSYDSSVEPFEELPDCFPKQLYPSTFPSTVCEDVVLFLITLPGRDYMATKGRSWEYVCEMGKLQARKTIPNVCGGFSPSVPPAHQPSNTHTTCPLLPRLQFKNKKERKKKGNNC